MRLPTQLLCQRQMRIQIFPALVYVPGEAYTCRLRGCTNPILGYHGRMLHSHPHCSGVNSVAGLERHPLIQEDARTGPSPSVRLILNLHGQ